MRTSSRSSPLSWASPSSRLSSRSQTPPPRRSPPPHTPDSTGLIPSSRRSYARQRTCSPTSPSPSPIMRLERPRRTIRPQHFYGDTPTPPPLLKQCSRHNHLKPLEDYIDRTTREERNVCEACHNEIQRIRLLAEIQENIQRRQDELERAMGAHGRFNVTSF